MPESTDQKIARGQEAKRLLESPALLQAMDATKRWAWDLFLSARTPDEAWFAKCRFEAMQQFHGMMLATVKMGEHLVKEMLGDPQAPQDPTQAEYTEHLKRGAQAREEWDRAQAEKANGGPSGDA